MATIRKPGISEQLRLGHAVRVCGQFIASSEDVAGGGVHVITEVCTAGPVRGSLADDATGHLPNSSQDNEFRGKNTLKDKFFSACEHSATRSTSWGSVKALLGTSCVNWWAFPTLKNKTKQRQKCEQRVNSAPEYEEGPSTLTKVEDQPHLGWQTPERTADFRRRRADLDRISKELKAVHREKCVPSAEAYRRFRSGRLDRRHLRAAYLRDEMTRYCWDEKGEKCVPPAVAIVYQQLVTQLLALKSDSARWSLNYTKGNGYLMRRHWLGGTKGREMRASGRGNCVPAAE
ncbi:hypothetical protein BKA62DRAFT_675005 [Auriculariales sp. MPI-PUGE-AT-0066]|nr:hypothetical protein BKA62DRAFT_675005 [Auriculariales sp. MPI-PUGE-AT-0066]